MDKQIYLGKHLLHGTNHFGQWVTEAIEGWDEPPAVRDGDEERTSADGSFHLPTFYSARTPTLDGIMFGESRAQAKQALQALNANARLGLETLTITDAGKTQWAKVKLAGLDYTWVTNKAFRWQLRLKSPDPRKFGDMNTFTLNSGTANGVFHRGNYWATPKYTIRGNMPGGYTLHLAGTYFTVGRALTSSAPHTIDFRNGRLYVGGALTSGGIAAAANLTLVGPGGVPTAGIEPTTTGTAVATMELLDTFI